MTRQWSTPGRHEQAALARSCTGCPTLIRPHRVLDWERGGVEHLVADYTCSACGIGWHTEHPPAGSLTIAARPRQESA